MYDMLHNHSSKRGQRNEVGRGGEGGGNLIQERQGSQLGCGARGAELPAVQAQMGCWLWTPRLETCSTQARVYAVMTIHRSEARGAEPPVQQSRMGCL